MFRRGVAGIDADRLHGVDRLKDALNLGPAIDAQQNLAAGTNVGHGLIGLRGGDGAHDVDARDDGPEVVGRPPNESEDAAGAEADDAPVTAEDLLFDMLAEADPVLDLLLNPGQFDMGERVRPAEGAASLATRKRRRARCS